MKKSLIIPLLIFALIPLFIYQTVYATNLKDNFSILGYKEGDLEYLRLLLREEDINKILTLKIKRITLFRYINHKGFTIADIDRYENLRRRGKSATEAVNRVNHPYISTSFYKEKRPAINLNTNLILINKNYQLEKHDVPMNLITCTGVSQILPEDLERNLLQEEACNAYRILYKDMLQKGMELFLSSGYRSITRQEYIYNQYILEGELADSFSARPGHSEHHSGLSIDVTSRVVDYKLIKEFGETIEGQFLKKNAHKYGFIIRYPKDKENITGYSYEPWHLRYVGNDYAQTIYKENLSLEEYLLKYTEMEK